MGISRLSLGLAFGVALAIACGSSSGGSTPDAATDSSASCGAQVQCGGGYYYQKCTDVMGDCYIKLSSDKQLACSSCGSCPESNPCDTPPSDGGGGGSGGSGGSGGAAGAGGSGGAGDDGSACGSDVDAMNCADCCLMDHMEGAQTYVDAVGQCACVTPGACKSECSSSFCMGKDATKSCGTCLENSIATMTSACYSALSKACGADPDCVAFNSCLGTCQGM